MNRILSLLLLAALLLCGSTAAFAQTRANIHVSPVSPASPAAPPAPSVMLVIDGKLVEGTSVEMAPRGQQILVWLRDLERIGWGVIEPGPTPDKTIFRAKTATLTFIKGQSIAIVNSLAVQIPINADMRNGRLMVPLSFVAKSLGYGYDLQSHPVAIISTADTPATSTDANTMHGQVLYGGRGVSGIRVSVVDPDYNTIKNFGAVTNAEGNFTIAGLPNGRYMAYVWIGDNPEYFNRVSEEATLSDSKLVRLRPISLGRILHPISPKLDEVTQIKRGRVSLQWTPCEAAASYKLVLKKYGSGDAVMTVTSATSNIDISARGLVPGLRYAAEIEAHDAAGKLLGGTAGSGGRPWTFTIKR